MNWTLVHCVDMFGTMIILDSLLLPINHVGSSTRKFKEEILNAGAELEFECIEAI